MAARTMGALANETQLFPALVLGPTVAYSSLALTCLLGISVDPF